MSKHCPNIEGCPIYKGILQGKNFTTAAYRENYCDAGEDGRNDCRRWQVAIKYGKCPESILPNSSETVEQIALKFNLE